MYLNCRIAIKNIRVLMHEKCMILWQLFVIYSMFRVCSSCLQIDSLFCVLRYFRYCKITIFWKVFNFQTYISFKVLVNIWLCLNNYTESGDIYIYQCHWNPINIISFMHILNYVDFVYILCNFVFLFYNFDRQICLYEMSKKMFLAFLHV